MTSCEICELAKRDELKVFEDEKVFAFLSQKPAGVGHIQIATKGHYPIIEYVPDFEIGHLFQIANKLSVAVFESLGMQGTNLLVANGLAAGQKHAHFIANIIPRREGDGLSFEWKPKQLGEEEMSTVELKLKESSKNIGEFEGEKEKPIEMDRKAEKIKEAKEGEEESYLLKQLRRIP